jgi:hypothetical protein
MPFTFAFYAEDEEGFDRPVIGVLLNAAFAGQ